MPLGRGLDETQAPRYIALTTDGTRGYVTLQASGGIAVIDTVGWHEVDLVPDDPDDPETVGVQHIELPAGAKPFAIVVDRAGRYAYVTDELDGVLYVIDIDPFSPDFNRHVQTIVFETGTWDPAPLGLRGLALSADQKRLYVAAPGRTLMGAYGAEVGYLLVVITDPTVEGAPFYSAYGLLPSGDTYIPQLVVGPDPYSLTATDDPNVMLVTDRLADTKGLGIVRRYVVDEEELYRIDYVNLVPFGVMRRYVEGRDRQVFGVCNAQGVVFLPANTFSEALEYEHPSYAFITGFNKYVEDDPKHNPNLGPLLAYNFYHQTDDGRTIPVPVAAGGNVGVIRNPLGDWSEPLEQPRLVAATRPVLNSFPDNLALGWRNLSLLATYQGQNKVFAFDTTRIVANIETEVNDTAPRPGIDQIPPPYSVPLELSALLRGPLSTLPIDDIDPFIEIGRASCRERV